jgi:hypothetical protein
MAGGGCSARDEGGWHLKKLCRNVELAVDVRYRCGRVEGCEEVRLEGLVDLKERTFDLL